MRALPTDNMRRFVVACNQPTPTGEVNYTQAARDAGYADTHTTKILAHRLAHDERIQAAILEEAKRRFTAALPMATAAIIKVMATGKASDQLRAAEMVLNRGGIPVVTEHKVNVTREESLEEKLSRAVRLAKDLGMDPRKLLGTIGITDLPAGLLPAPLVEEAIVVSGMPELDPALADFLK